MGAAVGAGTLERVGGGSLGDEWPAMGRVFEVEEAAGLVADGARDVIAACC